jgi:hypothetical protein
MQETFTRRHFLGTAAAAGVGLGSSADCRAVEPRVEVCNPLRRTPLSLIIDDSCPVINKAYYWIKQRHVSCDRQGNSRGVRSERRRYDALDYLKGPTP